jgi:hypothetical protein
MGRALIAFARNNQMPSAASVTVTSANSSYPPQSLIGYDSAMPSKASSTTATWTFYMSGNITPVLVSVHNYNWNNASAITFGNSAGFVTSLTNNTRTLGGFADDTWKELTGSNRTDDVWFLTVTGANTYPAVGKIAICTSFSRLPVVWGDGAGPDFGLDFKDTEVGDTFYGTKLLYTKGIRQRTYSGEAVEREEARSILHLAAESAQGRRYPFLLITDESDVTSAQWVRFANTTFRYRRTATNMASTSFDVEEWVGGPVL